MEKIRLKLKAYDHRVLDRSVASIVEAVRRTGAEGYWTNSNAKQRLKIYCS